MLYIYNSLTREKERFVPIEDGKVSMYVCGITPYSPWHIGNARSAVLFDMVRRYFLALGNDVTFVRNITDIDDKIINRANESGEDWQVIAKTHADAMRADLKALNGLAPDHEPHCTEYVPQIIAMVEKLIEKGHAYATECGDVYFDVQSFPDYGKLTNFKLEDVRDEVRVEHTDQKRFGCDFALWKSTKHGEPSWTSPWGEGRPGWHIECSAMSTDILGATFDIHAGGMDLKHPHHNNEIAQSCCATGESFANVWIHNGMLEISGVKMSKSLGNLDPTADVLERFHPEIVRFYLLSGHYRKPLHYSEHDLNNAKAGLERLYNALRGTSPEPSDDFANYKERFHAAMDDDFNTPEAYAVLFDMARDINRWRDQGKPDQANRLAWRLQDLGGVLGLLSSEPEQFLKTSTVVNDSDLSDEAIEHLINERIQARAEKNWQRADELRDELANAHIVLEDVGDKTSWRRG